jgi:Bacterial conjugation TrbI-like protein
MENFSDEPLDTDETPSAQELAALISLQLAADDPVLSQAFVSDDLEAETQLVPEPSNSDVFDDEEFDPEKNTTKVTLQNNGLAKAALVGGASLTVILGGVTFFQSQMPKGQVAQAVSAPQPSAADDKVVSAQAAATKAQQSESETKAQLALAKQKDSLAQAQQSANPGNGQPALSSSTASSPRASIAVAPVVVSAPNTRATWSAAVPRTPSVAAQPVAIPSPSPSPSPVPIRKARQVSHQPVQVAAAPAKPIVAPQPIAVVPSAAPVVRTENSPVMRRPITQVANIPGVTASLANNPTDSNTELQQLAAVGRYGTVSTPVEVPAASGETRPNGLRPAGTGTVATAAASSNILPLAQYFQRYANQEPIAAAPATVPVDSAINSARPAFSNAQALIKGDRVDKVGNKEEPETKQEAIESATTIRTLLVGTSAKGSAMTPVLWGGGASSSARFMLKLDEPMLDGNNRQAFPAGTQFIVTAKPASANIGLAELEVVSIIIKGMEFAPPNGSIVIRDDQGGLLIGEDYFRRDAQIANRDLMTVFTGALGGVGRIMNQPASTSSFGNNGTVVNTVTNRDPNILGGILEGGFKDLSAVWTQRNQEAIQDLLRKPNVYQIPRGHAVRVFVNQSMTF